MREAEKLRAERGQEKRGEFIIDRTVVPSFKIGDLKKMAAGKTGTTGEEITAVEILKDIAVSNAGEEEKEEYDWRGKTLKERIKEIEKLEKEREKAEKEITEEASEVESIE